MYKRQAKTRYSQTEAACTAAPLPDGRLRVTFDEPQRAVTAGQAVVLYDGEEAVSYTHLLLPSMVTLWSEPISRLIEEMVRSGLVMAWRLAT